MDYVSALFGFIGGSGAMLAALYFFSKKLVEHALALDIEEYKGAIAHRNALAATRIEHIRALWQVIFLYSGAFHTMAYGTRDETEKKEARDSYLMLRQDIAAHGIFIGSQRVEEIYKEVGEPMLKKLLEAKKLDAKVSSTAMRDSVYLDFQNRWLGILNYLENLLNLSDHAKVAIKDRHKIGQ